MLIAAPVVVPQRKLTIHQAQMLVNVSRRTIYNWLAAGKLEYVRTAGGSIRIVEASLWRASPPAR